jgi:hypothetical protein
MHCDGLYKMEWETATSMWIYQVRRIRALVIEIQQYIVHYTDCMILDGGGHTIRLVYKN